MIMAVLMHHGRNGSVARRRKTLREREEELAQPLMESLAVHW